MKITKWLSDFSCLSEFTRLYPTKFRFELTALHRGIFNHYHKRKPLYVAVLYNKQNTNDAETTQNRKLRHNRWFDE